MDGRSRAIDCTWEEKSKIFASKRDDLVRQCKELQKKVAATLKSPFETSDDGHGNSLALRKSMNDFFMQLLHLLYTLDQIGIDETKAGLCFRPKMKILDFIIGGVVKNGSVRLADHRGILDVVGTHFGRLTLDPDGMWDESAARMDYKADKVFKHYRDLAGHANHCLRRSEVLTRDLRWFHDCWRLVAWYEPQCGCLQCTSRSQVCTFREVCWMQDDYEVVNRVRISPGVETLDPLEVWEVEMNDYLGETY
ncbi:hypothetical protein N7509_005075 [Penicillium cosmopolitanum]|uniref:Uncharacterized protein n=1 Tax=Penicillium cosmopolitanum TaxID=1131564 RepID=A0A9X0B9R7_9EURO|nr:uncharacterized protein N7509_005075 [Penicillium cosmopolitanum]KAJ5396962.1 hypothetical protein N7509_005075 [Penicillium cosmopolitanum]